MPHQVKRLKVLILSVKSVISESDANTAINLLKYKNNNLLTIVNINKYASFQILTV